MESDPWHLAAIDAVGGQALFQRKGNWFLVSVATGWIPESLPDVRDAVRLSVHSSFVLAPASFDSEERLVEFVRDRWKSEVRVPDIRLDEIVDELPSEIRNIISLDEVDFMRVACEVAKKKPQAQNRLFEWLENPSKLFAEKDLQRFYAQVPRARREDAVQTAFIRNFDIVCRVGQNDDWKSALKLGGAAVASNNAAGLQSCFIAATVREAREECDHWLRNVGKASPSTAGSEADDGRSVLGLEPVNKDEPRVLPDASTSLPQTLREPWIFHQRGWNSREIGDFIGISDTEAQTRVTEAHKLLGKLQESR